MEKPTETPQCSITNGDTPDGRKSKPVTPSKMATISAHQIVPTGERVYEINLCGTTKRTRTQAASLLKAFLDYVKDNERKGGCKSSLCGRNRRTAMRYHDSQRLISPLITEAIYQTRTGNKFYTQPQNSSGNSKHVSDEGNGTQLCVPSQTPNEHCNQNRRNNSPVSNFGRKKVQSFKTCCGCGQCPNAVRPSVHVARNLIKQAASKLSNNQLEGISATNQGSRIPKPQVYAASFLPSNKVSINATNIRQDSTITREPCQLMYKCPKGQKSCSASLFVTPLRPIRIGATYKTQTPPPQPITKIGCTQSASKSVPPPKLIPSVKNCSLAPVPSSSNSSTQDSSLTVEKQSKLRVRTTTRIILRKESPNARLKLPLLPSKKSASPDSQQITQVQNSVPCPCASTSSVPQFVNKESLKHLQLVFGPSRARPTLESTNLRDRLNGSLPNLEQASKDIPPLPTGSLHCQLKPQKPLQKAKIHNTKEAQKTILHLQAIETSSARIRQPQQSHGQVIPRKQTEKAKEILQIGQFAQRALVRAAVIAPSAKQDGRERKPSSAAGTPARKTAKCNFFAAQHILPTSKEVQRIGQFAQRPSIRAAVTVPSATPGGRGTKFSRVGATPGQKTTERGTSAAPHLLSATKEIQQIGQFAQRASVCAAVTVPSATPGGRGTKLSRVGATPAQKTTERGTFAAPHFFSATKEMQQIGQFAQRASIRAAVTVPSATPGGRGTKFSRVGATPAQKTTKRGTSAAPHLLSATKEIQRPAQTVQRALVRAAVTVPSATPGGRGTKLSRVGATPAQKTTECGTSAAPHLLSAAENTESQRFLPPNCAQKKRPLYLHRALAAEDVSSNPNVLHRAAALCCSQNVMPHVEAVISATQSGAKKLATFRKMVNVANPDGYTPLMIALLSLEKATGNAIKWCSSFITFLLNDLKADPNVMFKDKTNATCFDGYSALHFSVACSQTSGVDLLLPFKPTLEVNDSEGHTPLVRALLNTNYHAAAKLVKLGANTTQLVSMLQHNNQVNASFHRIASRIQHEMKEPEVITKVDRTLRENIASLKRQKGLIEAARREHGRLRKLKPAGTSKESDAALVENDN